jgi:hypothetical protein
VTWLEAEAGHRTIVEDCRRMRVAIPMLLAAVTHWLRMGMLGWKITFSM